MNSLVWRDSVGPLVDDNLQDFLGLGMLIGFAVLRKVLLVLVSGSVGSGSAQKFMRDLGLMLASLFVLEDRWNTIRRGDLRLRDLGRESTFLWWSPESPK